MLPPLARGTSTGTMCLTRRDAGTDLGTIRTRAEPDGTARHRISASKIFITAGEHDLTRRYPPSRAGPAARCAARHRADSAVRRPARLEDGTRNGVACISIEHKMGIRASATCTMAFEGAVGELIGEPHRGMRAMFTMMNAARLGVGIQGSRWRRRRIVARGDAARAARRDAPRRRGAARPRGGPDHRPSRRAPDAAAHPVAGRGRPGAGAVGRLPRSTGPRRATRRPRTLWR